MKRSEMLSILLGSIYENIGCCEGLGLDTEHYAKILDDLEKAGMKPPARKIDYEEYQAIRQLCAEPFNHFHKWDKE
jgi:hypothetical protein